MKKIIFIIMLFFSFSVNAEITTKEQADEFLSEYCIELVNGIQESKNKAEVQISEGDFKGFLETAGWIGGIADVYSKLCK